MGALLRAHDWSRTSLGSPADWPQALRTALRLILNTGHPMYVFWGPDLLCFYNDAYRQSIGPERHPGSLGLPAVQVWAEIWDIIGPQIDQVMAGRGATWHENALVPITRNGRLENVYWTYSYGPIDDDGSASGVGGVLVVCTETTQTVLAERRQAEEADRQRRVFQQAPGFICTLRGPDHVFEFVNDAHRRLFASEDWVGKPVREAFPDIEGQGFYELLDQVYATGEQHVARGAPARFRRTPDEPELERFLDFVYAPLTNEAGQITGIFCEGTDVSEQLAAERALRESEEQLRLAVEAAEIGLWDVDVVTDTLFWPPRVKAMFGISPDVSVSMADYYAGLHPDDRDGTSAAYATAADPQMRALYDVEYRTVGKEDGVVRWVAAKGRGVFDDQGRCVRVIGTAIDITARKDVEAQLKDLNETLERRVADALAQRAEAEEHLRQAQKIEAVGRLTGGVAHDFNNLLMVISGGLSLLDRPQDSQRRQRIVDGMRQAAARGASLSRQLLAFSRKQPLRPQPVDLRQHVSGMSELLDRTLRGDVHVETRFEPDVWPVNVDPTELELVLLNLCVNARDAMASGGVINVSASNRPDLDHNGLLGDFVCLAVTDTGAGIPSDVLSKVFEPFFTTKDVGKGSGLGLPQVYGFAEQSGGAVEITSTVGQGTCVSLLLPRSEVQPAPAITTAPFVPRAESRENAGSILLVEDDDEVAELVMQMLGQLGYGVTRASSAAAALGALANGRVVDLVFSDVMMPGGMSGVELAEEIRRRRPALPILLTSGYSEASREAAAVQGLEILAKPFDLERLALALDRIRPHAAAREIRE